MPRNIKVWITPEDSYTGVGIGSFIMPSSGDGYYTFLTLCPNCSYHLIYRNAHQPDMVCQSYSGGGCGTVFTSFPSIPSSVLRHGGPWMQAHSINTRSRSVEEENKLIQWIDRWTNLIVEIDYPVML